MNSVTRMLLAVALITSPVWIIHYFWPGVTMIVIAFLYGGVAGLAGIRLLWSERDPGPPPPSSIPRMSLDNLAAIQQHYMNSAGTPPPGTDEPNDVSQIFRGQA